MSSPQGPRGGRKRSTQLISGNHLLGFSSRRDPGGTSYSRSNSRQQHHHHHVFDRSMFLAANFRFGMSRIDPGDAQVDWDDVIFLDMEAPMSKDGMIRCPISLDAIELPYITPCGHVFSLVSILTDMLMKHDGVIRGTSPCPICNVDIRAMELRPVHIRYVCQDLENAEFRLVWRYKTSTVVHACGQDTALSDGYYPIDIPRFSRSVFVENPGTLWKYIACRLAEKSEDVRLEGGQDAECYYPGYIAGIDVVIDHCRRMGEQGEYDGVIDDIRGTVNSIIESSQALEASRVRDQQLEEEFPSLSVSSLKPNESPSHVAELSSWKRDTVRCQLPIESDVEDVGKMYMYQKSDGQWIFLNLFNMKMLHSWRENYDDMPTSISGRIVDVERFEQTEETKRRMRPFGHIPVRANITLCELDLSHVLPKEVLDTFDQELTKRRARRESLAKQKARALRLERRAEQDIKNSAVVDFSQMPPLVDTQDDEPIDLCVEDQGGVSFAKIAELGFAALGPTLTGGEPSSSPPSISTQSPPESVWASKNRKNASSEPSGKKKGSKQILLFSTSKRQY